MKTTEILESFYEDCLKFWKKNNPEEAEKMAYKDVERITTNPYSPSGEKLDEEAKRIFLKAL